MSAHLSPPCTATRPDPVVVALATLAVLAAVLAPGGPTGSAVVDAVYRAALGVTAVIAAPRARRWTWLVLGGGAAVTAPTTLALPAWASLAVALAMALAPSVTAATRARAGAAVAALAVPVLLCQRVYGFQGLPLVVGMAAVVPVLASALRHCPAPARRRIGRALWGAGGLAVASVGVGAVAVASAMGPLRAGADGARSALREVRAGETGAARADLAQATIELEAASAFLDAPWARPARLVPFVGQHLTALSEVAATGAEAGRSGAALAELGDYRDLRYRSGGIDVARVEALGPPLASAAEVLDRQARRLRAVDRDWLVGPLRQEIEQADRHLGRAAGDAQLASSTVRVLPGLLGANGPRRYLVAFLNPAEERGLGGFSGSYGELSAVGGRVRLVRSGSSVEIEAARPPGVRALDGPQEFLARHGTARSADSWRDASSSPHFPYAADVMTQIFEQTHGVHVDGVLAMDAYTVAALLRLTGPIRVPGYPAALTADNAADVIVRQQYLHFADTNAARKDLLEAATAMAFDRLLQGDLPGPRHLVDVLGPMVRQRRLMFHARRPPEQRLFERIGADGSLRVATSGEVLLVAHQNFANNKIDAYLRRRVHYDTVVDAASGAASATATIRLTNDAPAAGLPDYVIGNSRGRPPGTNLMNLLVYSRLRPVSVRVDGRSRPFRTGPEAGLHAASVRLAIPAGASSEVVVRLVGPVDLRTQPYTVRVLPQPMVNPDRVSASIRVRRGTVAPAPGSGLARDGTALVLPPIVTAVPVELPVEIVADR
ncbi:MAG: hypothetical protein JWM47_80 [Acidimicrobiales bacterium]|nr:hypothetical protein [Acidimicrobiales bacterium]